MKTEAKAYMTTLPVILSFRDYHDILYVQNYINEIFLDVKVNSQELSNPNSSKYHAVFFIEKDRSYDSLIKEFNDQIESENYNAL